MFQFVILLIYVSLVSAEYSETEYENRDGCSGVISQMKLGTGVNANGALTVIWFPGLAHNIWTGVYYLRVPLVLAYYNSLFVTIHSGNCYREDYSFKIATFKKQGQFEQESLPIIPLHPGGYEAPCAGIIKAIRFTFEGEGRNKKNKIHIQLNTEISENYTRASTLIRPLIEAFIRKAKIHLITNSCRTGDLGFASYNLLDRGSR
ncbi:uncharacterized protein LOC129575735 [Sitodiplosis mosellana]|uniref:uncharacterized protein LOC129575735 n=1 Tax=Sitodiplosis mosellana TaxID=263140 RepID=UPI0024441AD8|nr:uncharacterized protein LOC129575735 [Sitodiplosis mosellana]XP_055315687.1 uncharacterized protein LOC129575735 [Sitodiplosis mosellana]